MSGPTTSDPAVPGPLDRQTAEALLARADVLLAASEFDAARAHYARLIGFPDPAITGAALLGTGEALFQLDDEVWATRFEQRDAVSLPRPGRRIQRV